MRVAAAAGIALGRDQHMLAQGRQGMTTERTAIRRRLAVRRSAHRPPAGRGKSGHRSIVAPLAATLAATFAVGVGVAIARSSRARNARTPPPPEPHFALLPGERLAPGLRRIATEQCDLAIALLGGNGALPDEHAVHETRKALKRLRTLVRLLEDELGEQVYARESASLRTIAARLAGARDAEVMHDTLETLIRRHPRKLRRRRGVAKLRKRLAAEHARASASTLGDAGTLAPALAELQAFRLRATSWPLGDRNGLTLVEPGLRGVYAKGRRRRRRAARAKRNRDIVMHEWRKRVKDLRYAAELLQRSAPAGERRRASPNGRARLRPAKRLARTASRADELGELLGEDHDLALLAQLVRDGSAGVRVPRRTRRALLKLIARRRRALRTRALRIGEKLYRKRAKTFIRDARADFKRQRAVLR